VADTSRAVAQAARAWADQHTSSLADLPAGLYIGTVATTSPLKVSWRKRQVAAYKVASYTPAAGDRVLFAIADDQLVIIGQIT
jgi:Flp pilus assembly protein TadG